MKRKPVLLAEDGSNASDSDTDSGSQSDSKADKEAHSDWDPVSATCMVNSNLYNHQTNDVHAYSDHQEAV